MNPPSFAEYCQLLGHKPKRPKTESQRHWKVLEKWLKTDGAKRFERELNEIKH